MTFPLLLRVPLHHALQLPRAAPLHATSAPVSAGAITRTAHEVFRAPAYNDTSLLSRFFLWLLDRLAIVFAWLRPAFAALRGHPVAYWAVIALLIVAAAAIVARAWYLWHLRRQVAAGRADAGHRRAAGRDPWLAAHDLAARGDYTRAAHALYFALLEAGARREQIRLHPSKTIGDYVRELRARSSSLLGAFREFARSYELVIYGIGRCDRERYERLHALAAPIVGRRG